LVLGLADPALACYVEEDCGNGGIIYAYGYEGGCITNCSCYGGNGYVGYTYFGTCQGKFVTATLDCGLMD